MADYYICEGDLLVRFGKAPDGMEAGQAGPGQTVVVGTISPGAPQHSGQRFNVRTMQWIDVRNAAQVAADAAHAVAAKRLAEYPSIGDQLDMLWHAMDDGSMPKVEPFYSQIKAVKDANPKA